MSIKPTDIWANNEVNVDKPTPQALIDDGFVCGPANPDHMNWILWLLSQSALGNVHKWNLESAQEGGYIHPQLVLGSDGLLYTTVVAGTYTNNPVGDGGTNWLPYNITLLPNKFIEGLTMTWVSVSSITVNEGTARDFANSVNMVLSSAKTKSINAVWAEGTGVGGRASGIALTANTWYRVFAISKPNGTTDCGFDTATNASGLLADAASLGYTKYRRIGWVRTDGSSNIRRFVSNINDQDAYLWDAPITDVNGLDIVPTVARALFTLTVPPSVRGDLVVIANHAGGPDHFVLVTSESQTDTLPSVSAFTFRLAHDNQDGHVAMNIPVSSSSQVGVRRDAGDITDEFLISTRGWRDNRRTV